MRFGPVGGGHAGEEQQAHRGEDRPALALVADHAAQHIGQCRADREDRDQLDEIGQRVRVLVGMRRVGVQEAAAIGAEDLDRFLRGDRALRDRLLGAFERRRVDIGAEILRHALPHVEQRDHHRERQQDVERAAGQIDPEIADRLGLAPHKAADQRQCQSDAGRRRDEIVHRQPSHLHQIAHRGFRHVGLPVGVGDEADRGVEGEALLDPGLALRIERQIPLQPLQRVERHEADDAEQQHRHCIGQPVLLLVLVDAAAPIDRALDRPQHRPQECPLAGEDACHVAAERPRDRDHDHAEQRDLHPAIGCHPGSPRSARG